MDKDNWGTLSNNSRPVETGIDVLGPQNWGTHICQLFSTPDDLVDVVIPFIVSGLEDNEYCLLVTAEPLEKTVTERILEQEIRDYRSFISNGQLEIISRQDYYCREDSFSMGDALISSVDKYEYAIERDFSGIRISGNLSWLDGVDFKKAIYYESKIDEVIPDFPVLSLFSYALPRCSAMEILAFVAVYDFVIVKSDGRWTILENGKRSREVEELRENNIRLENYAKDLSLDIRQPLANIILGIDMLDHMIEHLDGDDSKPEIFQIAETIRNYAGKVYSRTEELLESKAPQYEPPED